MVTRRTILRCFAAAALVATPATATLAQRATQVVTFRVEGIDQLAFTGAPTLVISSAATGQSTASVRTPGGTWSVTTNRTGERITANVDEELPPGLVLSVHLQAPSGAQSIGFRSLGATPVEVIRDLSPTAMRDLPLTYQLDAKITAGTVVTGTRTVIFTITAGM